MTIPFAALALLLALAPATPTHPHVVTANAPLVDLRPQTTDPIDGASARMLAVRTAGRTVTILNLRGLDRSAAGRTLVRTSTPAPACPGTPSWPDLISTSTRTSA
jgi:hypothetical protein